MAFLFGLFSVDEAENSGLFVYSYYIYICVCALATSSARLC